MVHYLTIYIYICGKFPITREWIYGITLVFPTVYYFCLVGHFGGCVVAIIVNVVGVAYLFIYLFICLFIYLFTYLSIDLLFFSATSTVILTFVAVIVIATVALIVGSNIAFCVCLVTVVANLMLMLSILVLLFAPFFTVNSVDKYF